MVSNNDQLAAALKRPYKTKSNSIVAPGPKHTFQVDLRSFNYEQAAKFTKNPPPPHGLVCVDVFTKQVQIVPLFDKTAVSWKDGLGKLIDNTGRPQNIMTDPEASITSVEVDESLRRNMGVRHIMTRHHTACAERALREFKQITYKEVKHEVKPWTEYLPEVFERLNTGKQSNRVEDKKVYPNEATGSPPDEAAKQENRFEAHSNLKMQAAHKRKYPDLKVGDEVKVFKERGALSKKVVGDF